MERNAHTNIYCLVNRQFASKCREFREYNYRIIIRILSVEWRDFPPWIAIKYSSDHLRRRDARVFISGLDRRQIENSQTLVVNNRLRLITLSYATLDWQSSFCSPFLRVTSSSTSSARNDVKCDWKRAIKRDVILLWYTRRCADV